MLELECFNMNLHSTRHEKQGVSLHKRQTVAAVVLGCIFSFFCVAGYLTDHAFNVEIPGFALVLLFIVFALVMTVIVLAIFYLLDRIERRRVRSKRQSRDTLLWHLISLPQFWIAVQALLLIFWLPVLLAAWPGFFCYDTETLVAFDTGKYFTEHPLLYTLLASNIIINLGTALGSVNSGATIYVCLTALFASTVLCYLIRFIAKSGHLALAIAAFVFYALDPIVVMFSLCTAKDVLSSLLLSILFMLIIIVTRNNQRLDS